MKKIGMLGYGILLMCMTACSHADITMKTDKVEFVEFYLSGTEADELAPKIRREMEKLGYQRKFAWEESSEAVFQRVERYKKWIG